MRRALPAVLLALLMVSACSEPQAREYFLRSNSAGEYSFSVELTDSLHSYDFSFYTAIDKPLFRNDTLVSFPMQVVWRSPSGRYFSETVYYPADSSRVLYRSGMMPSEFGEWSIGVTLPQQPPRLRGLGIIVSRNI